MPIQKRLKRIYYIPGIITLVIAPILFMYKTNKYISDKSEHCISITTASKYDKGSYDLLIKKRAYQNFILTGQNSRDSLTLVLIENYARGINLSENDSIGIKVVLGKNIKYKTYIDLLNTCLKSDISTWIPYGDTVFIFYKNYINKREPLDTYSKKYCQNIYMPEIQTCLFNIGSCIPRKKPSIIQKIKNEKETIKLATPILIIYLILAYVSIKKLRN